MLASPITAPAHKATLSLGWMIGPLVTTALIFCTHPREYLTKRVVQNGWQNGSCLEVAKIVGYPNCYRNISPRALFFIFSGTSPPGQFLPYQRQSMTWPAQDCLRENSVCSWLGLSVYDVRYVVMMKRINDMVFVSTSFKLSLHNAVQERSEFCPRKRHEMSL